MRRDSNTRTGARNYRANYQHEGKRINTNNVSTTGDEPSSMELQFEEVKRMDQIDERMGFPRYQEGPARLGWLINMHPTLVPDKDTPMGRAGVDYYFLEESGDAFKCTIIYSPYFLIGCLPDTESEVEDYLKKRFEGIIENVERVYKEDLKMPNHLLGKKRLLLKLSFRSVRELLVVRKEILAVVKRNAKRDDPMDTFGSTVNMDFTSSNGSVNKRHPNDALDNVNDIREYDVPYYVRVAIDNDIRVGLWYDVKAVAGNITLTHRADLVKRPEPVVLAFDIETTKLPLKFPDATIDAIMMISYMVDGQGFLITNREIVSQDIDDFEYTPKPEFEGNFQIFNEPDEVSLLRRFFEHIEELRPTVIATYNGDVFDWPFVEARARFHGIDMKQAIGFYKDEQDEYKSRYAIHMDCFRWVKRDSYLPVGSHGLKAVTKAKLGYHPDEIDPEDMTRFASERPQTLAQYSVSDAVATYYLYMKYVHPFIFSLCNIIPSNADEVLRKGSGTLCELLLMVEAYRANVVMPNKHQEPYGKLFDGHLLESETYVGGHVEALEAGVFRSDIPIQFKIVPSAAQQLIDQVEAALRFTVEVEEKKSMDDVLNFYEIRDEIIAKLTDLRDRPERMENPKIYHLDVAAMYPNIILTNRLQPDAIVDESVCATCDFNLPGKNCDRRMTWLWRGQYYRAEQNEYHMIRNQLETEQFPGRRPDEPPRPFHALTEAEQDAILRKRIAEYSRRVYTRTHETKVVEKEAIICQRENPFYINTVLNFRDRRYEYKNLHKVWKKKLDNAVAAGNIAERDEASKMVILYDSLQLAHKCILNSFYGYVMRKGARWYSMEMAGVVCHTGATIIQMARQLIEQIGRPLELDTDGIWCALPSTFPENFKLRLTGDRVIFFSYPCVMLNHLVHDRFTNRQYQVLVDPNTFTYSTREENSIFFEVDGPYYAMMLPSSKEADKLLKKRYAVFNFDGSLAELKGFEVKRRGELKLIKIFQSQIFKVFLEGSTLQESYAAAARVANQWLDVLFSKGEMLRDEELLDLICENRSMTKSLEEYAGQKSTSISTARRLAEFLGDQMVKDKGLACRFIISAKPLGDPISERAIPVAIFSADPPVKKHFLRKWLKDSSLQHFDIRDILDWDYYLERLGSVVQKLITIPAAMQRVANPVPRVRHPDWLHRRLAARDDKLQQKRITDIFQRSETENNVDEMDIEDFGQRPKMPHIVARVRRHVNNSDAKRDVHAESHDMDLDEDTSTMNGVTETAPQPRVRADPYENYAQWLKEQKPIWRMRLREREKELAQFGNIFARSKRLSMSSYLRNRYRSLMTNTWQLLQICETDTPGELRAWIVANGQMYDVRLLVPRKLYVNSRVENWDELARSEHQQYRIERRNVQLPRSHYAHHVFEISMTETAYLENIAHFQELSGHSTVAGIYETQVKPLDRALICLGCVRSVTASAGRIQGTDPTLDENTFLLEELTKPRLRTFYLGANVALQYLYCYHATFMGRHFIGLFSPLTENAHVFVIDSAGDQGQLPNLKRMFEEQLRMLDVESSDGHNEDVPVRVLPPQDHCEFSVYFYPTEKEAFQMMHQTVQNIYDRRRAPIVLIMHSPWTQLRWRNLIRSMEQLPILSMPSHKDEHELPPLNWQKIASRRMIQHYLRLDRWLADRIEVARYADVPLCNLGGDTALLVADLLFARQLQKNGHVLWWSHTGQPDLGRGGDVDYRFELDEIVEPEINVPTSSRTVCIDIALSDLAANALLESSHLGTIGGLGSVDDTTLLGIDAELNGQRSNGNDLESESGIATLVNNVFPNASNTNENAVSPQVFALIKTMTRSLCQEYAETGSHLAGTMIEQLQRWISSNSSHLYDPRIHELIHKIMHKTLTLLVSEIKSLGAQIIFANFSRIVLCTSKVSIENANAYISYLIKTIDQKSPFRHLNLDIRHYWERLIWLDPANYGGVLRLTDTENSNAPEGQDASQCDLEMHWRLMDYLPVATHEQFKLLLAEFIYQTHRTIAQLANAPPGARASSTTAEDHENVDEYTRVARRLIERKLTRSLLRIVPDIHKQSKAPDAEERGYAFPELVGNWRKRHNVALEFVNAFCHILSLEQCAAHQVRVLKRSLLALLDIREFSDEAKFQDPCASIRLPNTVCLYCGMCVDLDLCQNVLADVSEASNSSQPLGWHCPGCQNAYDHEIIEEQLINLIERRMRTYQLQDLRCRQCRWIKADHLSKVCSSCAGEFVLAGGQSPSQLKQQLSVFKYLAKFHAMPRLAEIIDWYQQYHG